MQSSRVVIAVDLDYFFAQCEEIRRPELKSKPVVVCVFSGRTQTSGAVSTSNYVARKLGVKSGIPIINAKKILSNNPEAVFLPVDHLYYDSVSKRIMRTIKSNSPLFEQVSVDEAFIDVSEVTKRNFDSGVSIGRKIKQDVMQNEDLTCSVGIGPNKLIAKMAADYEKPDGLTTVLPENVFDFIRNMPTGKLIGIGPKIEKKMQELHIRTIGDLANFDVHVLSEEFGKNLGPRFKQLANGMDDDPVKERPIEQISRIITLKCDTESFTFKDELRPLAIDIAHKLDSLKLNCKIVGIIAITSDLKSKSRMRTLEEPIHRAEEILDHSTKLFQEFFASSVEGENRRMKEKENEERLVLRRVGIRVSGLAPQESERNEVSGGRETLAAFFP